MNRILALLLFCAALPLIAAEVPTIAVLRPVGADFAAAERGLTGELPAGWTVVSLVGPAPTPGELATWLTAHPAQVLVAMDNAHITAALPQASGKRPLVALMGLDLKQTLTGQVHACGIAYETPIWSLVTGFMARTGATPKRVLVPYRSSVHALAVADATRQLVRQGITVVPLDIEDKARGAAAQAAWLTRNLASAAAETDAVVVPADNVLVDARSLPTWLNAAQRSGRPFLGPVARFVDERHGFCTYAAEVDHERLGAQTAELVLQLGSGKATPGQLGVEYLVGVGERLDAVWLRRLGLNVRAAEGP